jgi:hypothetical protein
LKSSQKQQVLLLIFIKTWRSVQIQAWLEFSQNLSIPFSSHSLRTQDQSTHKPDKNLKNHREKSLKDKNLNLKFIIMMSRMRSMKSLFLKNLVKNFHQ